jgi:citrate lyase subunit beta/citryl-CoA lyase
MNKSRPLRSALYVPGNKERAIEKAGGLPVDAIIFDLEDAVANADKDVARAHVCGAVEKREFGRRIVVVRINDPATSIGKQDLAAAVSARPDAVLVPKVREPEDLVAVSELIEKELQAGGSVDDKKTSGLEIWAMMETPQAILYAKQIAGLKRHRLPRLTTLIMGSNDLVKETGTQPPYIVPWLMNTVLAAKAYGLSILDGVYNAFSDDAGLRSECERGRAMGMNGKTLIHPGQVDPCNEIFSPSLEQVQEAEKIIEAFEVAENSDSNVLVIDGRMVERLHYEMARSTMAIAQQIKRP